MPASNQQIEPAGVRHIEKAGAPTNILVARPSDTGRPTDVLEAVGACVAPKRFRLLLKRGDEKAEAAGVVVIPEIDTHVAELRAIAAKRNSREHADFGKSAVAIVVIEIVGNGIVGDDKIGPAVVVVIGPHRAEAVVADLIMDASFHGDFFERAIPAIVVEKIALAFEAPRAALHLQSFI